MNINYFLPNFINTKIYSWYRFNHISYSQTGEDLLIDYIFKARGIDKPYYIDIGAHHPWKMNNTALFYLRGASGINIEPDPLLIKVFKQERKRDKNLNFGIAVKNALVDFYIMSEPALNTLDETTAKNMVDQFSYKINKILKINVYNINDILKTHSEGKCPDLLSIDTEGNDFQIIKSINFNKIKPKVLCVETLSFSETGRGSKNNSLVTHLINQGYMIYADTNINTIFVLKDFWQK